MIWASSMQWDDLGQLDAGCLMQLCRLCCAILHVLNVNSVVATWFTATTNWLFNHGVAIMVADKLKTVVMRGLL